MTLSRRSTLASFLLFVFATVGVSAAGLSAHVESPNGAPRIVINGQPVRARMFFGAPGSSAVPIGPEWQQIDFEFTASGNGGTGTMHFRFGHGVSDVFLDKIQVTDIDEKRALIPLCDFENGSYDFDRDWTSWPLRAANTVAKIAVDPQAGHRPLGGWTSAAPAGFATPGCGSR